MSSIYKVGTSVVCPEATKYGDKGNVSGTIQNFRLGTSIPYIEWSDGLTGYVKPQFLITEEKYNQLTSAGFKDSEISEYVRLFNGNIYN
jgi:hypothetical protein